MSRLMAVNGFCLGVAGASVNGVYEHSMFGLVLIGLGFGFVLISTEIGS